MTSTAEQRRAVERATLGLFALLFELGGGPSVTAVHRPRPRGALCRGPGYGHGHLPIVDGDAANDAPRFLVFSARRGRRAGLQDVDPLAREVSFAELRQLAEGVVADLRGAQAQANELGGAYVRTPTGGVLWLDPEDRDVDDDQAVVRDERQWADERVARRGEVSP